MACKSAAPKAGREHQNLRPCSLENKGEQVQEEEGVHSVTVSCGSESIHQDIQHARVAEGPSPLFGAPRILKPHEIQLFFSSGINTIFSKCLHQNLVFYPSNLKKEARPVPPIATFFTAVIPYAWPFTRPKSVLSSLSSREAVCKTWHVQVFCPLVNHENSHLNGTAHESVVFDLGAHDVEKLLLLFLVVRPVPRSGDVENFRDAASEVDLAN